MPLSADARALLHALPEPALIAAVDGRVEEANRAAVARFGQKALDAGFMALCDEPGAVRAYLERASGSREPLLGSLQVRSDGSAIRLRAQASLLTPADGGKRARLLVRLSSMEDPRFSALTVKVRELDAEVRRRQHAQAVLEEALQERSLLLRELHHRVKNNMQMLAGMLAAAQRETASEEARTILGDASRRLAAVGAVQQMLYASDSLASVRMDDLLETLVSAILQASGATARLRVEASPAELANDLAVPVALILNELLANALKHARPDEGEQDIRIGLTASEAGYVLSVEDDGPGFDLAETRKRASGLGLVRGMVRQLGGSLAVDRSPGARVTVRFHDRSHHETRTAAS